jgi:hypothetical protein
MRLDCAQGIGSAFSGHASDTERKRFASIRCGARNYMKTL